MTRSEAIATALAHGPALGILRADVAAAAAQMLTARAFPNPTLSAAYSKDAPQYHLTAELPLDFLWLRDARIQSAAAAQRAGALRFVFGRAAIALTADTTYTRALAARARSRLSERNALAADSLRRIADARRAAGDAADLEVELATVSAGQQANIAAADSLTLVAALLDLQSIIGLPTDRVTIDLADSLTAPAIAPTAAADSATLPVAAATAALESATLATRVQRRSLLSSTGLMFGFETGDPSGDARGVLPTFGIAIPLPFLNRNRGPIAEAEAARARASAELDLARIEAQTEITRARRTLTSALARVGRDLLLLTSANRVATMSLAAYREGASPLANVLEAQRAAREVQGQYIDDLASASIAAATLRLLTLTPGSVSTP